MYAQNASRSKGINMQFDFATTTLPTLVLWGLGLLVFLIGGGLGYFNMNIDANKKLEGIDQKMKILKAETDRKIADANSKLEEARALEAEYQKNPMVESSSMLSLKNDGGQHVKVYMDGQPLTAPLTPEKRKRLIELINHIRPWLEGSTTEPRPMEPARDVSKPVNSTPLPPSPTSKPFPPSQASYPPAEVKPVPLTISLNSNKPKMDPEMEYKLLSMVQQIDRVLQARIDGTPLAEMSVQLKDTLQGGLQVHIGTVVYETIDDVPDANVRNAIRAAIAEWEQKYIPGT